MKLRFFLSFLCLCFHLWPQDNLVLQKAKRYFGKHFSRVSAKDLLFNKKTAIFALGLGAYLVHHHMLEKFKSPLDRLKARIGKIPVNKQAQEAFEILFRGQKKTPDEVKSVSPELIKGIGYGLFYYINPYRLKDLTEGQVQSISKKQLRGMKPKNLVDFGVAAKYFSQVQLKDIFDAHIAWLRLGNWHGEDQDEQNFKEQLSEGQRAFWDRLQVTKVLPIESQASKQMQQNVLQNASAKREDLVSIEGIRKLLNDQRKQDAIRQCFEADFLLTNTVFRDTFTPIEKALLANVIITPDYIKNIDPEKIDSLVCPMIIGLLPDDVIPVLSDKQWRAILRNRSAHGFRSSQLVSLPLDVLELAFNAYVSREKGVDDLAFKDFEDVLPVELRLFWDVMKNVFLKEKKTQEYFSGRPARKAFCQAMGIPVNSSDEVLKKKFREIALQKHSDKYAGHAEYEECFKKLTNVYRNYKEETKKKKQA